MMITEVTCVYTLATLKWPYGLAIYVLCLARPMSDDARSPTATEPQPTDVRFSVRALLIVTVPVAMFAAAIGPYFRGLTPDEQIRVGVLTGICLTLLAAWLWQLARTRYRLEREAGQTILQFAPRTHQGLWSRPWTWLDYLGGYLMIGFGAFYLLFAASGLRREQSIGGQLYLTLLFSLFCSLFMSRGIAMVWWRRAVQLRKQGILFGLQLLRWTSVTDCRWIPWRPEVGEALLLEGVDQKHIDVRWNLTVPWASVNAAKAVLADRLSIAPTGYSTESLSTEGQGARLFPMVTYREQFARGCFLGLTLYALCIVVAILTFRFNARGFASGFYVGLGVSAVLGWYRSQQIRRTGYPRVRLSTWVNGPALLVRLAIVATCCLLAGYLSLTSVWLAGALGIVCSAAMWSVIRAFAAPKLDLCENGVALPRWEYIPWTSIRSFKWDGADHNRVVLETRWRRLEATVLAEQHEAVERVLAEKIAR